VTTEEQTAADHQPSGAVARAQAALERDRLALAKVALDVEDLAADFGLAVDMNDDPLGARQLALLLRGGPRRPQTVGTPAGAATG
jgi:hypothetical protein